MLSRDEVLSLVRAWQSRLRLGDWTIHVEFTKLDDHYANCSASPEYFEATIQFDPESSRVDEATIIHELLHCYTQGIAHVAEELAGSDAAIKEWVRIEEERLVTSLEHMVLALVK